MSATVGIIAALPAELKTLTRETALPGQTLRLNESTLLGVSGIGPENAATAATGLIQQGCGALLSWGCAAALAPDLRPGDLLIPERILRQNKKPQTTDPEWRENILRRVSAKCRAHTGPMLDSPGVIETAIEKQQLHQSSGAIALDMESAAIVLAAANHKLPALIIRSVADPAAMDLPKAINGAVDARGDISLLHVFTGLLRHPASLLSLPRLGMHFHSARQTLIQVARLLAFNFGPPPTIQ